MKYVTTAVLLILGAAAIPRPAVAEGDVTGFAQSAAPAKSANSPVRSLLDRLDINPIAKARAAECKGEGELCKKDGECCPDLRCTGDPQPTCRPAE